MKKTDVIDKLDEALTTISGLISDYETGIEPVQVIEELANVETDLIKIKRAVEEQMPA